MTSWLVSAYDFYSRVVKNHEGTSEHTSHSIQCDIVYLGLDTVSHLKRMRPNTTPAWYWWFSFDVIKILKSKLFILKSYYFHIF